MKGNRSPFLIFLVLLHAAVAALAAQGDTEPLSCSDRSISASTVRTREDVRAFVQCAYEFVQEVGFEQARRAFHEDEHWRSGSIYVVVDEVTPISHQATTFVYPP